MPYYPSVENKMVGDCNLLRANQDGGDEVARAPNDIGFGDVDHGCWRLVLDFGKRTVRVRVHVHDRVRACSSLHLPKARNTNSLTRRHARVRAPLQTHEQLKAVQRQTDRRTTNESMHGLLRTVHSGKLQSNSCLDCLPSVFPLSLPSQSAPGIVNLAT